MSSAVTRWLGGLMLVLYGLPTMAAESVVFDPLVLKARGIDPALAELFRDAPRFLQGPRSVGLAVNGQPKGRIKATFDEQGRLCFDPQLLKAAGVRAPAHAPASALDSTQCPTFADSFPAAVVSLYPGVEQVDILVPTNTLLPIERASRKFARGGMAGLVNYDVLVQSSESAGQRRDYRSVASEIGMNAGDWVLRSRHSYTESSDHAGFEHLYAYGARTLESFDATLQIGQLNMTSPLFAGESFTGIQLQPDRAFARLSDRGRGARSRVEGVAYSAARIEVRQNGVMIYTTMVPSGPFVFTELPLLSSQLDLEVTVHEEDGRQRQFRVPAEGLYDADFGTPSGFNFALGQVRRSQQDGRQTPAFAAFSTDLDWSRGTRMSGGVMGATGYLSSGWGLQQQWSVGVTSGIRQVLSNELSQGQRGHQLQMTTSVALSANLSASIFAARASEGFRTLSDTGWNRHQQRPEYRGRDQWVFSLNGSTERWGALGANLSRYTSAYEPAQTRLGLSWSRMLPQRTTLSLTLERDVGATEERRGGSSAYLTLAAPLGGQRRIRSYLRDDERSGVRSGVVISDSVSETLAYSVSGERREDGQSSMGARLGVLAHYSSLDFGYSRRPGSTSFDTGARGAAVFHPDGVTLSPYAVSDTFAVLKAGDSAGLKLHTPQGPVWTDGKGRAVAATLPAYNTGRVEIDSLSLPRNVDVLNGFQEVEASRGSVQYLDFSMVNVRRLLLQARTADRQWLPQGGAVHDAQGRFLTTVLDAGTIFLSDSKPGQVLHVRRGGVTHCVLTLPLTEPAATGDELYERADALCHEPTLS